MAYQPIVNVDITISDVQVSADGFGTPLFITTHRESQGRIDSYSSAQAVADVFGTDSSAYRAATKAFGQSPKINLLKIGRRDGELRLLPVDFTTGDTLGFTVTNKAGDSYVASYVVQGGDTAEDIVTALQSDLAGSADVTEDCTPTVQGSTLYLRTALNGGDWQDSYFTVTSYVGSFNGADTWHGTEDAAQCFSEISEVDSDFFFIACDDNADAFVKAMAATVETVEKMYFVADRNADNIASVVDPDTSLFGELGALNYQNTVTLFHHTAGDSAVSGSHESAEYPEIAWICANSVYDAGSVNWANLALAGVSESQQSNGRRLTPSQKNNLDTRNANFIEYDAGNNFTRYGQTVGNDWIDTVRGVYWQKSDLTTNLKILMLGQKGSKIAYNGSGLTQIRETIATSLQRGVNRNFLGSFDIQMPRLTDISTADKLARVLSGVTFTADIVGAVNEISIQGTVSEG